MHKYGLNEVYIYVRIFMSRFVAAVRAKLFLFGSVYVYMYVARNVYFIIVWTYVSVCECNYTSLCMTNFSYNSVLMWM